MGILFPSLTWDLLAAIGFLVMFAYFRFQKNGAKYWSNKKISHLNPRFLIGNAININFHTSFGEYVAKLYKENKKSKMLGYWSFTRPVLAVFDLDLIKKMLVSDFSYFHDRFPPFPEKSLEVDPLSGHLFNLSGQQWRNMRVKLTPTFTSGKMKMMYPTMVRCSLELEEFLETPAAKGETIEIKDVLARFSTNIIASCAFGIETNALKNPDNEFRYYGKKIFDISILDAVKGLIIFSFPQVQKIATIRQVPQDITDFFVRAVQETMEYRKLNHVQRNDFLQLLIQLKEKGMIEDVDRDEKDANQLHDQVSDTKFTLKEAAAQAFVFFIAGFETSSTTMTFALYELAMNQDVQKNLKKAIQSAIDKETGEITYETIYKLEYLEWVIQETLRKYPVVPVLFRLTTKEYYMPEVDTTLPENQLVVIPLLGISRDPDIFPDPEKFDPTRFSPEEVAKRHHFSSIPFGEGPRNCIGNRFGLLQTKVGLVSIMKKFTVLPSENTPKQLKLDRKAFVMTVEGGMLLKLVKET